MSQLNTRLHTQWNTHAALYDKIIGDKGDTLHQQVINPLILQLLGPYHGKKIVDLGCGNGYLIKELCDQAQSVVGIDFSDKLLRVTANRLGGRKNVLLKQVDLNKPLPIENSSADVVLSIMVNQFVTNTVGFAQEVKRVLKKNGVFVLIIHHPMEMLVVRLREDLQKSNEKLSKSDRHRTESNGINIKRENDWKGNSSKFFTSCDYLEEKLVKKKTFNDQAIIEYFHRPVSYYVNAFAPHLSLVEMEEIFEGPLRPRVLGVKWER